MNSKSNRKGGGRTGSKARRPYSTIELKATEVTGSDAGQSSGQSSGKAPGKDADNKDAGRPEAKPDTASSKDAGKSKSGKASTSTPAGAARPHATTQSGPTATTSAPGKTFGGATQSPSMSAALKSSEKQSKDHMTKSTGTMSSNTKSSATKAGAAAKATATAGRSASAGSDEKSGTGQNSRGSAVNTGGGGGGFISHMAAGIIGALLAFFGASYASNYLAQQGVLPAIPGAGDSSDADKRIAALEKALATSGGTDGSAISGKLASDIAALRGGLSKLDVVNKDLADLKTRQGELSAEAAAQKKLLASGSGSSPELTSRLAQLEQTLAALGAAAKTDPNNAGRIPQLAALSGRLNDLETALKTRIETLRDTIATDVDDRLSSSSEASEAAKSGTQRLDRDVAALRNGTAKMDQRLIELQSSGKQTRETLRVVQEGTGSLKIALESLQSKLASTFKKTAKPADIAAAVAPIATRIGSLEKNLKGVVQSEENRKSTAKRIVLALELGNLKRAMDRGQSFKPELAEVQRVAGSSMRSKMKFDALEAHKSSGVPTLSDLQSGFKRIAFKIIDAASLKENATLVDQLLRGAKSMVRVRQVNHQADDASTEAIVGRMDLAIKDGRLGDVIAAAGKLSAKAVKPAEDWLDKVRARQSVDKAIASIEEQLKSSLSGEPAGEKG